MKRLILCLSAYFTLAISYNLVIANETNAANEAAKVEHYTETLYDQLDFGSYARLSYKVFSKAMMGYMNLRAAGKLSGDKEIITICDLSLSSTFDRLWTIDLAAKKVLFNTYVAHGQGTGEELATSFSNIENSHKSSLGFYVTGDTYQGDHGLSLRLQGMDKGFNDAAFKRDIVVHGADYVSDKFICQNDRLGRSWGCPAIPMDMTGPIINTIKEGTCLFIYYPEPKYLSQAYWLNKRIAYLPDYQLYGDMKPVEMSRPPFRRIEHYHNGQPDSVKRVQEGKL